MDCRGWIPILVLASFNRVRQLTPDHQLVKDVLTLSSLVEVRGDWVRTRLWKRYTLPNAPESTVEPGAPATPPGDRDETSATGTEGEAGTEYPSGGTNYPGTNDAAAGYSGREGEFYPRSDEYGYHPATYDYYPSQGPGYGTEYTGHNGGYVLTHQENSQSDRPGEVLDPVPAHSSHGTGEVPQEQAEPPVSASSDSPSGDVHHGEQEESEEESEELESEESEVEFVLGKDANRSWTAEKKQG